jgi:hypothetical protein
MFCFLIYLKKVQCLPLICRQIAPAESVPHIFQQLRYWCCSVPYIYFTAQNKMYSCTPFAVLLYLKIFRLLLLKILLLKNWHVQLYIVLRWQGVVVFICDRPPTYTFTVDVIYGEFLVLKLVFSTFSNPKLPKNKHITETLRHPMNTLRRKVSIPTGEFNVQFSHTWAKYLQRHQTINVGFS